MGTDRPSFPAARAAMAEAVRVDNAVQATQIFIDTGTRTDTRT
ncbi:MULTISPECIES: hypothetical protein [unclassified Streptomyces]